jgi:hypothetical protein
MPGVGLQAHHEEASKTLQALSSKVKFTGTLYYFTARMSSYHIPMQEDGPKKQTSYKVGIITCVP